MSPRLPPKPASRPGRVSLWRYVQLFKKDILSAQPERLYRAWMAEYRTLFFRSYLINDPKLIHIVLKERPKDFPKSDRIGAGLRPLLGNSVFLTNDAAWERQRRMIDPAFEGGRLRDTLPAMWEAAEAAVLRLEAQAGETVEIEAPMSHVAADVIFRTLFSIPIDHAVAADVFDGFKRFQRAQPIVNFAAFVPLPRWVVDHLPQGHPRKALRAAARIRALITELTAKRRAEITAGMAPDDLANKIMTAQDPETGGTMSDAEMVDQVAIFFLAGHETSASALSWSLYLLALYPEWQERVAKEVAALSSVPSLADLSRLKITRNVFREALRLYPPVPMMVRENRCPEAFRDRHQPVGSQMVLSPWHLHRHTRLWERPDAFDPGRFDTEAGRASVRDAYLPFSSGPRVCIGAGFAMAEGVLILARLLQSLRFAPDDGPPPVPVAHLTVRAQDGIRLRVARR